MNEVSNSFATGGPMMYPIVLAGLLLPLVGLGLLVRTRVTRRRALSFSAVMLVGAAVAAILGGVGYEWNVRQGEAALREQRPDVRDLEHIHLGIEAEALTCVTWGFGAAIVPTLLGFALLGLGLSRRPRFQPPSS